MVHTAKVMERLATVTAAVGQAVAVVALAMAVEPSAAVERPAMAVAKSAAVASLATAMAVVRAAEILVATQVSEGWPAAVMEAAVQEMVAAGSVGLVMVVEHWVMWVACSEKVADQAMEVKVAVRLVRAEARRKEAVPAWLPVWTCPSCGTREHLGLHQGLPFLGLVLPRRAPHQALPISIWQGHLRQQSNTAQQFAASRGCPHACHERVRALTFGGDAG